MKKYKKIGIISVSFTVVILLFGYFGLSAYIVSSLTKIERIPITVDPGSLGISYEDVSFTSRMDKLVLKGTVPTYSCL